jgi:hypothetical protein
VATLESGSFLLVCVGAGGRPRYRQNLAFLSFVFDPSIYPREAIKKVTVDLSPEANQTSMLLTINDSITSIIKNTVIF